MHCRLGLEALFLQFFRPNDAVLAYLSATSRVCHEFIDFDGLGEVAEEPGFQAFCNHQVGPGTRWLRRVVCQAWAALKIMVCHATRRRGFSRWAALEISAD